MVEREIYEKECDPKFEAYFITYLQNTCEKVCHIVWEKHCQAIKVFLIFVACLLTL